MRAVIVVLRGQARRRWRAWVALALLVGVAGGATMALVQAARRSGHAYRRFADAQAAADVVMTGRSSFGLVGTVDLDTIANSRYVERVAPAFVAIPVSGRTDRGRRVDSVDLFPVAATDERLGHHVERWKLLSGRRADPARANEATASFVLAERLGLHVGDHLDLRFSRADRFQGVAAELLSALPDRIARRDERRQREPEYADGPRLRLRVVGIEASPAEFPPLQTDLSPVLHLTPAFAEQYRDRVVGTPLAYFRLRHRSDLRALQLAVERSAAGRPVSFVSTRANQSAKVERAIRAEAIALAIVSALVGLTAAVGIGQALNRQALVESGDVPVLRALGTRDRQLRAIVLVRVLAIAVVGALIAGVTTVLGAQLALLPLARKAELDPGAHVDAIVLLVGTVAILGFALLVGWWSGRTALAGPHHRGRHPRITRVAAGGALGALPVPATLGVRLGLQRAARAIPPWATIAASALTIALLTGALTFTANLQRLLDEPHRYGWNWDVKLGAPGLPDLDGFVVPALRADPQIEAVSAGTVTQIDAGRARIDVLALERIKGVALPTIIAGRAPVRPGEIALGSRSMRALDTRLGGTIDARIGTRTVRLRVVGRSVFPEFGDAGQLGTGSLMTRRGVERLLPDTPTNVFLVRFAPSVTSGEGDRMARAVAPIPARFQARPEDLIELSHGGGLLVTLVTLLAVLGFVGLLHALLTSVRGRIDDYSVLRMLGLARRQTRAMVLWQVVTLAVLALLVGLPLGSIAGRRAWLVFADGLGVANDSLVLDPIAMLVIAGGALLVALAAAVIPAAVATRARTTGGIGAG